MTKPIHMILYGAVLWIGVIPAFGAVVENDYLRYSVGEDGRNLALVEKSTGKDLLPPGVSAAFAHVRKGGSTFPASGVSAKDGQWTIAFSGADVEVVLAVRPATHWIEFEVLSVRGDGVEELTFLDIPLNTQGTLEEPVSACALALNLQCNVPELPGPMKHLLASCCRRFGFEGAKVAVLAAPPAGLRAVMKEAVSAAEGLPHSALGGPWALDAPINRGSYLIDSAGQIGEDTVDAWVELARNLGMGQIDFHPGHAFRFGDLEPNPKNYPNGLEGVKSVVDKLHAAGIAAGLHTYAFFFAKDSRWVVPTPDPRLATDRIFTLAEALTDQSTQVAVMESTAGMSAVTGFQVRNSVTLRVDDELITYEGVQTDAPFAFTGCKRGAYGTRIAPHAQNAQVAHLKECFGLFVPDGDSSLFAEVAARTAEVYNACGFDMIYLDALDGADILGGGENAWHYSAKFVFEIEKRLARPALFEMSAMSHHVWYARSRMGAWDVPARAMKSYVDIHTLANADCARRFLPAHLGWWGAFDWSAVQPERTFPDVMEYLGGKCIANDCGLSLLVGFTPDAWEKSAHVRRLGGIVKAYEELRLSGKIPEVIKARLRTPGDEFTLDRDADGHRCFRAVQYLKHTVADADTRVWTVNNQFARQATGLRIEALASAAAYTAPGAVPFTAFTDPAEFSDQRAQQGVTARLDPAIEAPGGGPEGVSAFGAFTAQSNYPQAESAWALAAKTLVPLANLYDRAFGLWVHGDGQGEVLNVQLKSPAFAAGGIAEHYINVDFTGWRYCLLIEPESDRIAELGWPYSACRASWGGNVPFGDVILDYNIWVDYAKIETFTLGMNNLPPGKEVRCLLSPVHALPIQPCTITNPAVTIGDKTLVFPVAFESGSYLEYRPGTDCILYDAAGNAVRAVDITGGAPVLESGDNAVQFACEDSGSVVPVRARITVISTGDILPID